MLPIGSVVSALLLVEKTLPSTGSTIYLRRSSIAASEAPVLISRCFYLARFALQYNANNDPIYNKVEKKYFDTTLSGVEESHLKGRVRY